MDLASKSLALSGMDIFLIISHKSSKAAASLASSPQQTNRQQMGGIFPYPHAHFLFTLTVISTAKGIWKNGNGALVS